MEIFEGKTIILGAPKHFNLDKVIENELASLGFKVINISFYNNHFSYKNWLQRLEYFFMRNALWKREYKTTISFSNNKGWIKKKLSEIEQADFTLIIRPDFYPLGFISNLRKKGGKFVAYQWDGLNRFPQALKYVNLFDRFFVFDKNDLALNSSMLPITNYYPMGIKGDLKDEKLRSDVFYSGNLKKERIPILQKIIKACELLGQKVAYHLYDRRIKDVSVDLSGLKTTNQQLDYKQNIIYTYHTKIIIDLVNSEHIGLSFRAFEAVGFEKKLITTNKEIKKYDLYHPDNVLIWDDNSLDEIRGFIEKPYTPLPRHIKEKYSFKNWIQYVLDEGVYTLITIPN